MCDEQKHTKTTDAQMTQDFCTVNCPCIAPSRIACRSGQERCPHEAPPVALFRASRKQHAASCLTNAQFTGGTMSASSESLRPSTGSMSQVRPAPPSGERTGRPAHRFLPGPGLLTTAAPLAHRMRRQSKPQTTTRSSAKRPALRWDTSRTLSSSTL